MAEVTGEAHIDWDMNAAIAKRIKFVTPEEAKLMRERAQALGVELKEDDAGAS